MKEIHAPNIENYRYGDRHCFYRSEKLEISPEEMAKIEALKSTKTSPCTIPQPPVPLDVIIDTDLGTDLDDGLALLYALHLPNINILGVTTNYGPSKLRAAIVQRICDAYWAHHPDSPHFPVIAGASFVLGTHRAVFLGGHEGKGFFTSEEIERISGPWSDEEKAANDQTAAADFINQMASEHPGLTIISIGIPTNIGLALKANPSLSSQIREIVLMGCGTYITKDRANKIGQYSPNPSDWDDSDQKITQLPFPLPTDPREAGQFLFNGKPVVLYPNHNISGDTLATKMIFDNPDMRVRIISHAVTSKFWLTGSAIDYLKEAAQPLLTEKSAENDHISENPTPAAWVGVLLTKWFELRGGNGGGQCPHDPLTVHEAAFGGKQSNVVYIPGTLVLHEWAAYGTFIPNANGKHFLGIDVLAPNHFLSHLSSTLMLKD